MTAKTPAPLKVTHPEVERQITRLKADVAEALIQAARHKNRADRLERILNRLISSTRDAVEAARQNVRQP